MARFILLCLALTGAAGFTPMPAVRRMSVATPAASSVFMTKCSGGGDGDPKGTLLRCRPQTDNQSDG